MTTYEYVARGFNLDDPAPYSTLGTFTSGTCLDTADGDTSYAEVYTDGTSSFAGTEVVTFRMEPVGAAAPSNPALWSGIRAAVGWKRASGAGFGVGRVSYTDADGRVSINYGEAFTGIPDEVSADGYQIQWATPDPYDWPLLATPGDSYMVTALDGFSGSPGHFRFTYFRVFIDTATTPPLRLMQRGDGLGMGSGRLFGAGTRQGSTRVFGAL